MRLPHLALLGCGWPAYVAKQTADHLPVFCLHSPSTRHRSIRRRGRHTFQRRLDQISSAGDRCESEGQDGRLGGCEQSREIDPAFPIVCITGAAVGRWPSRGVPNSVLFEKPFAPSQVVTAGSQLLDISTSTSQATG
jgi:hypothetical protein